MIKAIEKLRKAYLSYNPASGEGANELIKAYAYFNSKSREVDEALERVRKIFDQ